MYLGSVTGPFAHSDLTPGDFYDEIDENWEILLILAEKPPVARAALRVALLN